MRNIKRLVVALVVVVGVVPLQGFDLATHLYVASQTFDVWQDFDPDFYNALVSGDDSLRITTRKFYYIGLLLPDMIDTSAQSGEREIISKLHALPHDTTISIDTSLSVWGLVHISGTIHFTVRQRRWSPLIIKDETYQNVQTPLLFNGDFPNWNFEKLYEMAQYAKSQGWSPPEKAVIYGALMHVVEDFVAHLVMQPSLYGYRYTVEADSMLLRGLLTYFEYYHEILSQTYIPDWSSFSELFIPFVYHREQGFNDYFWYVRSYFRPHYSFYTYLHYYMENSPNNPNNYQKNWQDYDFMSVRRFIEAAEAKGYLSGDIGVLQERLESYMYAWSIIIYALYHGDYDGSNMGAIFTHPDWNADDIFSYIAQPALDCFYISNTSFTGDAGHLSNKLKALAANLLIHGAELFIDPTTFFSEKLLDNPEIAITRIFYHANGIEHWDYPWTYYLSPSGIDDLYASFGTDSAYAGDLRLLRREIGYWYLYASWPPPYRREYYNREESNALSMLNVYKNILNGGPTTLDYWAWPIARKAGVLGGMDSLPDTTYYEQPGVFELNFYRDGNVAYTKQNIPIEGPAQEINLNYDLVTFGGTKVLVKGYVNGGPPVKLDTTVLGGPDRKTGSLSFNAQDAVSEGADTVFFEVQTADSTNPNQFATMFKSDYRERYLGHPEIEDNIYYQKYFVNGNPVREQNQSPVDTPAKYWPYVLPLKDTLTVLNAPSGLSASSEAPWTPVTLT